MLCELCNEGFHPDELLLSAKPHFLCGLWLGGAARQFGNVYLSREFIVTSYFHQKLQISLLTVCKGLLIQSKLLPILLRLTQTRL